MEIFKPSIDKRYSEKDVVNALANKGVRVIIAGLDMDFAANPFNKAIAAEKGLPSLF